MTKYAIQAPNGQTYQIDGPEGATDEQVRTEVMRQHPDAATPPKERGEIGQSWDKLKGDVKTYASGITSGALWDPKQNNTPQSQAVVKAADSISQDAMDLPVSVVRAGLRKVGMSQKGASDLVGAAMILSPYGGPLMRDAGIAGAAGKAAVAPKLKAIGETITSEKRGKAAASSMATEAEATLKQQQAAQTAERVRLAAEQKAHTQAAAAAAAKAARLRGIAEKARARGNVQYAERAEAAANAAVPEPAIGTPRSLSDIGDTVRNPALAKEEAISSGMRARDDQFRAAMDEVTSARAAEGIGVSDTEATKALLNESRNIVTPDPLKRPTVGNGTAERVKLHKEILDALEPQYTRLDPDQIAEAQANGSRLIVKNGDTFKVTVASMRDADDLRRKLGKIATGEIEGYAGINTREANKLYKQVSAVMDDYAEGTSAEVQANWREGKAALEAYEKSRVGKSLVGTENGTSALGVSSSSIPDRIVSGGRDAVKQAAAVAGEGPVRDAMRSYIQNEFAGKSAKQLEGMVAPNTKLHDVVSADSELEAAVREHIANVRSAEQAGARAAVLERRSGTSSKRAESFDSQASQYDKVAESLTGKAGKAGELVGKSAERTRAIQQEITDLRLEDPKKVGARYMKVLKDEHAAGRINDADYERGAKLADYAEEAFKSKAKLDKWMGEAGWLAGGGTLGGMIGGPHGFMIGTGAGLAARTLRRNLSKR